MNRGFVIIAENTVDTDYVSCAETLAQSFKETMPNESITLITTSVTGSKYFDNVVTLPYGDMDPMSAWKLNNDWQVYEASPYEYTIKLEADMVIPRNVDYWWDILKQRDVVISSNIRNFHNELSFVKYYRSFITTNNLPDVYNALTYFRKSQLAEQFFNIVKTIFIDWEEFTKTLKCNTDEIATTDWVYSLACHILGVENTTLPNFTEFSMIHMKPFINDLIIEDWTTELIYELNPVLKIGSIVQEYPFHYHIKNFNNVLKDHYGNRI
jgi:hypothetical protein